MVMHLKCSHYPATNGLSRRLSVMNCQLALFKGSHGYDVADYNFPNKSVIS